MDARKEILDAIEIIIDKKMRSTAQIYTGMVVEIRGSTCLIILNGETYPIKVYGNMPTVGSVVPIFVPYGDLSLAFTISP